MKRVNLSTYIVALGLFLPATLRGQPVVPHQWVADLGVTGVNEVSPSPNGKFLVIDSAGTLRVHQRDTRAEWSLGVRGSNVVWSLKGDRIAFQSREEGRPMQIWTMPMNATTGKPAAPAQRVTTITGMLPALSPDGRTVAYQRGTDIYAVPVTGGEERMLIHEQGSTGRVHYSPDGNWLYYLTRDSANAPTMRRKPVSGGPSTSLGIWGLPLGMSSDGKFLAYYSTIPYASDDAAIGFSTPEGAEFARLRIPLHTYWGRWSNNGKFLFSNLDIPVGLNRITLANGQLQQISAPGTYDRLPALSADGKTLAVQRRTGEDYQVVLLQPTGQLIRALPAAVPLLNAPHQWSPDGRSIAAVNLKRQLVVYDVATGRERVLQDGSVSARNFAWRSNSAAIAFVSIVRPAHWEVREVTLDGKGTLLRTVEGSDTDWIGTKGFRLQFLDDQRLLIVRQASISVAPISGGAEREIFSEKQSLGQLPPLLETGPIGLAVSPDAKLIAFSVPTATGGETVAVVPVAGGAKRLLNVSHRCGLGVRGWHPDGRSVFIGTFNCDTNREDFQIVPLDGGSARPLTFVDKAAVDMNALTVAPDGSYIIYDSERAWKSRIGEIDVTALAAKAPPRK